MISFFLLVFSLSFAEEKKTLPYLGPGSDKLSAEEYFKIYRTYIQQSALLGYPFLGENPSACEQTLSSVFRQAGMMAYPVPAGADQVKKSSLKKDSHTYENYVLGGNLVQLERDAKSKNPLRLVWANSSSPKAISILAMAAKKTSLHLERDPKTGLERLQKVPVGYPHPFLDVSAQGLFVREILFNDKKDCLAISYSDNAWVNGFYLTDQICGQLRDDAGLVWAGKSKPAEFAQKQRERLRTETINHAVKNGVAKEVAEKQFSEMVSGAIDNDLTQVAAGMRNLSQCNQLAIGGFGAPPGPSGESKPAVGTSGSAK